MLNKVMLIAAIAVSSFSFSQLSEVESKEYKLVNHRMSKMLELFDNEAQLKDYIIKNAPESLFNEYLSWVKFNTKIHKEFKGWKIDRFASEKGFTGLDCYTLTVYYKMVGEQVITVGVTRLNGMEQSRVKNIG